MLCHCDRSQELGLVSLLKQREGKRSYISQPKSVGDCEIGDAMKSVKNLEKHTAREKFDFGDA